MTTIMPRSPTSVPTFVAKFCGWKADHSAASGCLWNWTREASVFRSFLCMCNWHVFDSSETNVGQGEQRQLGRARWKRGRLKMQQLHFELCFHDNLGAQPKGRGCALHDEQLTWQRLANGHALVFLDRLDFWSTESHPHPWHLNLRELLLPPKKHIVQMVTMHNCLPTFPRHAHWLMWNRLPLLHHTPGGGGEPQIANRMLPHAIIDVSSRSSPQQQVEFPP